MNIKKNDIIQLEITGMTASGSGVGRYEGYAVFVPLTAIGDTILARIVKPAKTYAFAKIEKLLACSTDRITSDCPVFSQCGGCCYRHITYEAELEVKAAKVRDAVTRIAGLPHTLVRPIVGAPHRNSYRNKALIPLGEDKDGNLTMGFYAVNSHRIVNCTECLLQPVEFNAIMQAVRHWHKTFKLPVYNEATHKGLLRRLYMRKAETTGEIMACVVINGTVLPHAAELIAAVKDKIPNLQSFVINQNRDKTNVALGRDSQILYGSDTITDYLCGLQFEISPLSFYQVNRGQAERLYEKAASYAALTGNEVVLDLYCGIGTIGLSMAGKAKKLIGIEVIQAAINNAGYNAKLNQVENAEFICADAAKAEKLLGERGERPDIIILDPPRKGITGSLLETIAALAPKRVVYVSCDPATLARDLKLFADLGYSTREITPFDLFPATAHVECVALLTK